jgi:hypothetical protein
MLRFSRHMAPFLAVHLLLVSVGIPLQRVYCACVGQESVQFPDLFAGSSTDQHAACQLESTHKDTKSGLSCCQQAAQEITPKGGCGGPQAKEDGLASPKKCLTSDLFFVQFGARFLVPDQEPWSDQVAVSFSPALASVYAAPLPCFFTAGIRGAARAPNPPPGLQGADIRILYQSFLC